MGFRIIWTVACAGLVFFAPWWLALAVAAVGAMVFSWYVEMVVIGILYDALFGGVGVPWYAHLMHTGIFAGGLLLIEGVKTRINV